MILRKYAAHIVGWQCRVLVEATTMRGLDNCVQIWGMDGSYDDVKYMWYRREDMFYERNSMLSIILRGWCLYSDVIPERSRERRLTLGWVLIFCWRWYSNITISRRIPWRLRRPGGHGAYTAARQYSCTCRRRSFDARASRTDAVAAPLWAYVRSLSDPNESELSYEHDGRSASDVRDR